MLMAFLRGTVPADRPSLTGKQSLLKLSPGMCFNPQPDERSSLIRFNPASPNSYASYVQDLERLFDKYENLSSSERANQFSEGPCSDSGIDFAKKNLEKYKDGMVCGYLLFVLGPNCQRHNQFGYANGWPCVLVRINKVFGWLPETNGTSSDVLVNCTGENSADRESLGAIAIQPGWKRGVAESRGEAVGVIYSSYFPFFGQKGYRAPLLALSFNNIKSWLWCSVS